MKAELKLTITCGRLVLVIKVIETKKWKEMTASRHKGFQQFDQTADVIYLNRMMSPACLLQDCTFFIY